MSESAEPVLPAVPEPVPARGRPLVLSVLCVAAWIFFSLLTLLFCAGLYNAGWITEVTNHYIPGERYTTTRFIFSFGAAALLHAIAFTGVVLIWRLRRTGYTLLGIACLAISAWNLTQGTAGAVNTALYIAFILLFGLFYRRLR